MKKAVFISMLLCMAVTVMAQENQYWTTQQSSYRTSGTGRSSGALGLSTELGTKKRSTWFVSGVGAGHSNMGGVSMGRRSSSESRSYGSSVSFSAPRFSFRHRDGGASVSHSTHSASGRSVSTLGLTTDLSAHEKRYYGSGVMSGGALSLNMSTGARSSGSYGRSAISSRPVGDLATVTSGDAGTGKYTEFRPEVFNDAVPDAMSGPVGDAVIPMLVLLSLFVAYKKFRH